MDNSPHNRVSPPKVSVCIDVYNYADYLPQAIESALAQTLQDFELIIVDDCSTDDSFAVAQRYAERDRRIRVKRNPSNLGMVKNRNACLSMAQGDYVKFVHADDFLSSGEALSRMVGLLESDPAISLVAAAMQFVDAGSHPKNTVAFFSGGRSIPGTTVISRCLREQKNLIGGPSAVLFRRSLAARGFDERYFHAADLEMWFHLLEQGCFGYIREPLTAYRWHSRQQTEKDRGTLSQANDTRALLDTYLHKPYVRLKPWIKAYLIHDAVYQTVRRCRKLGMRQQAVEAVQEYGTGRYYRNLLWRVVWRRIRKLARDHEESWESGSEDI